MLRVNNPSLSWSLKKTGGSKVEVPGRLSRNPKSKELDTQPKSRKGAESLTSGRAQVIYKCTNGPFRVLGMPLGCGCAHCLTG